MLEKKGVLLAFIRIIKDMYEEIKASVKTSGGDTKELSH